MASLVALGAGIAALTGIGAGIIIKRSNLLWQVW